MSRRISGASFDIMIGDFLVHVENMTCTVNDGGGVAQTGGVPDGYTDGEFSADGEIELDTNNFMILNQAAKAAGSWQQLEPFDISTVADVNDDKGLRVDIFGSKLRIADLLKIDPKSKDKHTHKLKYDVTSPSFININGVPIIDPRRIEKLS